MKKIFSDKKAIMIFVLPAFLLYAVFGLIPIVYNCYISLFSTNLMEPGKFVGFRNYMNLTRDPIFQKALRNNLMMVVGSLIAHLPIALLFATLLSKKMIGSRFFQIVFFFPSVICGVAVGLLWKFVYHQEFGLLNKLLEVIGLEEYTKALLGDKNVALFCIIVVVMWQFVGYHMVIQIAAIKNIPSEVLEAARIDGAGPWTLFRTITFPLIKNILSIDAVLIITGSLKYYDLVAIMTNGGPNHATELMSTYMFFQGFRTLKYGYSASIGVVLLVLCALSVFISNKVFKTETIEY